MAGVPTDAYFSWGFYDSLIVVIPSLDVVAVRAGDTLPGTRSPDQYVIFKKFILLIAQSVTN